MGIYHQMLIVSTDVKKAYDSVPQEALWMSLLCMYNSNHTAQLYLVKHTVTIISTQAFISSRPLCLMKLSRCCSNGSNPSWPSLFNRWYISRNSVGNLRTSSDYITFHLYCKSINYRYIFCKQLNV